MEEDLLKKEYKNYLQLALISGCCISQKYRKIGDFHDGLAWVKKDYTMDYGFINKERKEVVPCQYCKVSDFYDGFARVAACFGSHTRFGFVDKTGKEIIVPQYLGAGDFHDDLAWVRDDRRGLYGYIDKTNKKVIPCQYQYGSDFHDGLAFVIDLYGNQKFIDKENNCKITCREDARYSSFQEGMSVFQTEDNTCGYIDKTRKETILPEYDLIRSFSDGLSCVRNKKTGLYGFINKQGREIIPCQYTKANDFSGGFAWVTDQSGTMSDFIDRDNRKLTSCRYALASDFHEGLAWVQSVKTGLYGFIDQTGTEVISCKYPKASDFHDGLAQAKDNRGIYFIDKQDRIKFVKKDKPFYGDPFKSKPLSSKNYTVYYSYEDTYFHQNRKMRYCPIYDYGNFVLCKANTKLYLYDKKNNRYTFFPKGGVQFYPHVLGIGDRWYYIGESVVKEITGHNFDALFLGITTAIPEQELLSYEEFQIQYQKDPDLFLKVEEMVHLESEKIKVQELEKQLQQKQEREVIRKKKTHDRMETVTAQLTHLIMEYASLKQMAQDMNEYTDNNNVKGVKLTEQELFVSVEEHLEIHPLFQNGALLQFLDLSAIDFTNVKVAGLDFSKTNAHIDPQMVYHKDMKGGNYRGLDFNGCDFEGVDIRGSDFTDCIMDFALHLDKAIYDETTIFSQQKINIK